MKKYLTIAAMLLLCVTMIGQGSKPATAAARFMSADVFVDSGAAELGAWQVEFKGSVGGGGGSVELVGVEGGEHAAFAKPAYYDPEALSKSRVILAAYSLGKDLPTGKTRVARVHVRVVGDGKPEFEVKVMKSAAGDGTETTGSVRATIVEGDR